MCVFAPFLIFFKNIIQKVKHCGGTVMVCFAASGPGLSIIEETMNSVPYQKILRKNVWPSVHHLKL